MGMVFRGVQTSMGRPVALKTLHPQFALAPAFFERFRREAEIASRLHHPNIITIYDFGRTPEGLCYFVMELLEGESLRQRVKRQGPLSLREATSVIEQVLAGVGHAHNQNVVHRDIKPHNIMVTSVDGNEYVKVLDFGLVKALEQEEEEQLTSTGQVLGTPQYMPPEQAGGEVIDQRSDLYSLTGVLYYALTGHSPFGANTVRKALTLSLTAKVPAIGTTRVGAPVPESIDRFVQKGLKPEKEDRYQTADDFLASLHAALAGTPDDLLDAVPAFVPEGGKETGSGSSSASKRGSQARPGSKSSSKSASVVGRPLPKSSSRVIVASQEEPQKPPEISYLKVSLAFVVLILLIIGAGLGWKATHQPPAPTPVPVSSSVDPTPAPPAPTQPDAPPKVRVTIATTPAGAEVLEKDVLLGRTPLAFEWEKKSQITLTFKHPGYRDLTQSIRLESDQALDFSLEALAPHGPSVKPKPPRKNDEDIGAFE
jgi:serine/threonine-protein kinase